MLCSFFIQSIYSLGCASIPSLCSLILLIRSYQTIIYSPLQTIDEEEEEDKQVTVEMKEESKQSQPSLWIAFLATGVTWFIYDFNVFFSFHFILISHMDILSSHVLLFNQFSLCKIHQLLQQYLLLLLVYLVFLVK